MKSRSRAFGYEILVIRGNCQQRGLTLLDSKALDELEAYIKSIEGSEPVWVLKTTTNKIRQNWLEIIERTREEYM